MPRKKTPKKPYRDFPLYPHSRGHWVKKIRGRTHYFGKDADAALSKYLAERDDLQAGRTRRATAASSPTLRDLVNQFLNSKRTLLVFGELSPRTWGHHYTTSENLITAFGKDRLVADLVAEDFEKFRANLAKTRGAHALSGEVQRVRTLFKFAWDEGNIDRPVRFGTIFRKPLKKIMRKAHHETASRLIEAKDVRRLPKAAGQPMRAMILLGINCGFGQSDVANLPRSAIDLKGGWINFPRPKPEVARAWLWPK